MIRKSRRVRRTVDWIMAVYLPAFRVHSICEGAMEASNMQ
jgi:hypothetical protein